MKQFKHGIYFLREVCLHEKDLVHLLHHLECSPLDLSIWKYDGRKFLQMHEQTLYQEKINRIRRKFTICILSNQF